MCRTRLFALFVETIIRRRHIVGAHMYDVPRCSRLVAIQALVVAVFVAAAETNSGGGSPRVLTAGLSSSKSVEDFPFILSDLVNASSAAFVVLSEPVTSIINTSSGTIVEQLLQYNATVCSAIQLDAPDLLCTALFEFEVIGADADELVSRLGNVSISLAQRAGLDFLYFGIMARPNATSEPVSTLSPTTSRPQGAVAVFTAILMSTVTPAAFVNILVDQLQTNTASILIRSVETVLYNTVTGAVTRTAPSLVVSARMFHELAIIATTEVNFTFVGSNAPNLTQLLVSSSAGLPGVELLHVMYMVVTTLPPVPPTDTTIAPQVATTSVPATTSAPTSLSSMTDSERAIAIGIPVGIAGLIVCGAGICLLRRCSRPLPPPLQPTGPPCAVDGAAAVVAYPNTLHQQSSFGNVGFNDGYSQQQQFGGQWGDANTAGAASVLQQVPLPNQGQSPMYGNNPGLSQFPPYAHTPPRFAALHQQRIATWEQQPSSPHHFGAASVEMQGIPPPPTPQQWGRHY